MIREFPGGEFDHRNAHVDEHVEAISLNERAFTSLQCEKEISLVSGAAHLDPEILIVDEVLAVGDLAFQKKCLKMRVCFPSLI